MGVSTFFSLHKIPHLYVGCTAPWDWAVDPVMFGNNNNNNNDNSNNDKNHNNNDYSNKK
jgi:hypothetical protein